MEWLVPRRRRLRRLRECWGKPGNKDIWYADRCFELTRTHDPLREVDDRSWRDLECPRLFAQMDTTVTGIGSQYLYRQLRSYADREQVHDRFALFALLRSDQPLRERIQLALMPLRHGDASLAIALDLFDEPARPLQHWPVLLAWSALSMAALAALILLHGVLLTLTVLGVLVVNLVVLLRSASRFGRTLDAIAGHAQLLRVANALADIRIERGHAVAAIIAGADSARMRVRRVLAAFFKLKKLPLGIDDWLNVLFLVKLLVSQWTAQRLGTIRGDLRALFDMVGALDAAIAVAGFLESRSVSCAAEFVAQGRLELLDARHPLLDAAVPNSIRLSGRSLLITGSNAAGKTTFLKTVACNVLLGRTLGVCCAAAAKIPQVPLMARIRNEHSLQSGKSHYLAEAEAMREFLSLAGHPAPPIYFVDEPFSGTNTRERIAVAAAVLRALAVRAPVLATTHDTELQALLADGFDVCHFCENPDVEGFFDYTLRPGAGSEGNAIRLLERLGFPPFVIAAAQIRLLAGGPVVATTDAQGGAMSSTKTECADD